MTGIVDDDNSRIDINYKYICKILFGFLKETLNYYDIIARWTELAESWERFILNIRLNFTGRQLAIFAASPLQFIRKDQLAEGWTQARQWIVRKKYTPRKTKN